MNQKSSPREISIALALVPLVAMIVMVIIGLRFEIDLKFILLVSAMIAGVVAYISGVKVPEMFDSYGTTIKKAFPAILILMAIGGIVGTWMYSGTVPFLIYYGLKFLHPDFILVSAFLVTAMVSTFTGTSWGSAATAGVAFIGIGSSMGIPLPMIAGAALSGAVLGDKVSPISDTTNLCALASEVKVYDHIKGMLPNVVIAGILSAIAFLVLGMYYSGTTDAGGNVESILSDLEYIYDFNLFMLLPAAVVFIGGYKGYNAVVLMISSSVVAILIGMLSNGFAPSDGVNSLISGFELKLPHVKGMAQPVSDQLTTLLNRGGFEDMLKGAVLYCILAIGFGSFMHVSGALDKLMKLLLSVVKSSFGLIVTAFVAGGMLNATSGNAAFSILTTGQLFTQPFADRGIEKSLLARSMENSMTLLESLLPWHVTAIYMWGVFGVSTMEYLPFAFFNIFGILLFFFLSWRTLKKNTNSTINPKV
ncbi:MAG: Na+/H+ antiporter NhaC family protein [Crocinitomicaceae bacterium]|nr:Na+/H+ antiporter NhaC family protein [Crocinitomicaceae bacterium]